MRALTHWLWASPQVSPLGHHKVRGISNKAYINEHSGSYNTAEWAHMTRMNDSVLISSYPFFSLTSLYQYKVCVNSKQGVFDLSEEGEV